MLTHKSSNCAFIYNNAILHTVVFKLMGLVFSAKINGTSECTEDAPIFR